MEPPAPRSEEDFDPAAKYHISADVEYMRYIFLLIVYIHTYFCYIYIYIKKKPQESRVRSVKTLRPPRSVSFEALRAEWWNLTLRCV